MPTQEGDIIEFYVTSYHWFLTYNYQSALTWMYVLGVLGRFDVMSCMSLALVIFRAGIANVWKCYQQDHGMKEIKTWLSVHIGH